MGMMICCHSINVNHKKISYKNGTNIGRLSSDTENELPEESSSLPDNLQQVLMRLLM